MCLTNLFLVKLQKYFSRFFKKRKQSTDSAVASNKTKRDFLKLQQDYMDTVYFFHSANSLTLHCVHKESFIAITRYRPITKAISVIDKSKLLQAITIMNYRR